MYYQYHYQMASSKRGAGGGSAHPEGDNSGSNSKPKLMPKPKWLAPANPRSLASQCLSGQPISTCHVLTGLFSQQQAKQFNALLRVLAALNW
jgi:hypothetical protein